MKIIEKIKNVIIFSGITILSLPNKIFGGSGEKFPTLNVPSISSEAVTLYGVPKNSISYFLRIFKIFIIPVAFIVGTIIYFKKSKSKVLKKILVSTVILIVLILVAILLEQIL